MSKNKFTMKNKDLQNRKNGRQSLMSKKKFTMKNKDLRDRKNGRQSLMSKKKFTMKNKDLQQRQNGRQSLMSKNKFTMNMYVGVYTVWGIVVRAWSIHGCCRSDLEIAGWKNSELGVS